MPKLPTNSFFFDIETTGFDPRSSSILSISYGTTPENVQTLYAQPRRGARVYRWVEKNVWEPLVKEAPKGAIGTERELVQKFSGILAEQQKAGAVLAGWNIGYGRAGQGFDISYLTARAGAHGLSEQVQQTIGKFAIRDIGQEYAVKITGEMLAKPGHLEANLFEQYVGYQKQISMRGGLTGPALAQSLAMANRKVAGWKQEKLYSQIFPDQPLKAHLSAEDVRGGIRLGRHQGPIFKNEVALMEYAREARVQMLVNQAIAVDPRSDIAGNKYEYFLEQARTPVSASGRGMRSMEAEFLGKLRVTVAEAGGRLPQVEAGIGMEHRAFTTFTGENLASKNNFKIAQLGDDIVRIAGKHKAVFALGAAALGIYALQPGGWFSGKDDEYNTIEGLPHQGIAPGMRQMLTDFGSGWRGLLGNEAFLFGSAAAAAVGLGVLSNYFGAPKFIEQKIDLSKKQLISISKSLWFGSVGKLDISKELLERKDEEAREFRIFARALDRYGKKVGTGHKRIIIPKDILSTEDITEKLGFVPVTIAIPEKGQTQFESYRHPDMQYHMHEHGKVFTMHLDRHEASTMTQYKLERQRKRQGRNVSLSERMKLLWEGIPHVITEGIPGAYWYAKGLIFGSSPITERIKKEADPKYQEILTALRAAQQGNLFSGKDDVYNTIEGLSHGGMAEKMRRGMTDFGSGYEGLKEEEKGGGVLSTIIGLYLGYRGFSSLPNVYGNVVVGMGHARGYMDVFHGTPEKNVQSIIAKGIQVNAGDFEKGLAGKLGPLDVAQLAALKEKASRTFFGGMEWISKAHAVADKQKGPWLHNMQTAGQFGYFHPDVRGGKGSGVIFKIRLPMENLIPQSGLALQFKAQDMSKKIAGFMSGFLQTMVPSGMANVDLSHLGPVSPEQLLEYKTVSGTDPGKVITMLRGKSLPKSLPNFSKAAGRFGMAAIPLALMAIGASLLFSGKDDEYNTIEGLSHKGIAHKIRKKTTDFGSGWIRKALSKGIPTKRILKGARRLGEGIADEAAFLRALESGAGLGEQLAAYRKQLPVNIGGQWWKKGEEIGKGAAGIVHRVTGPARSRRPSLEGVYKEFTKDKGKYFGEDIYKGEGTESFGPRVISRMVGKMGEEEAKRTKILAAYEGGLYTSTVEFKAALGSIGGKYNRRAYKSITEELMPVAQEEIAAAYKAGGYKSPALYEAAMQAEAHAAAPGTVPKVFARGKKGFIQEYAGRELTKEEMPAAAKFFRESKVYKDMREGTFPILHLDPHPSNLVMSESGELKIVDWGITAPMSKSLQSRGPRSAYMDLMDEAEVLAIEHYKTATRSNIIPSVKSVTKAGRVRSVKKAISEVTQVIDQQVTQTLQAAKLRKAQQQMLHKEAQIQSSENALRSGIRHRQRTGK